MSKRKSKDQVIERSRGRPVSEASVDLRTRLLDEAENRFAENGFAATSIRALAEAVEVNPALIHYYFGTKLKLLDAVMDRALGPLAKAFEQLKTSDQLPIGEVTRMMFEAVSHHPALPQLMVRQVLMSSGPERELFARKYAPRLGGTLAPILARQQSLGHLRQDRDPAIMVVMMLSLCIFPFIARPLAEPQLGLAFDEAGRARILEHITQLLERGLGP